MDMTALATLDSPFLWVVIALVLMPFAVTALVLAWKNPGIVFGLFLAIPFYKAAVDSILPVDITGLLLILLILPIMQLFVNPAKYHLRYTVVWAWILILVVVLTSMIASMLMGVFPFDGEPLSYLASYILLLWVPGFAAFRVVGEGRARRQMLWTLAAIGILTIFVGLVSLQSLGEFDRLQSLGSNTIGTARSALLAPFILVPLYWHRKSFRLPLFVLSVVALLVAVSAGSRGPVLFAFLAAITMVLIQSKRTKALPYLVGIGLALPVAAFATTFDVVQQLIPSQSLWRIEIFITSVLGTIAGSEVDWDGSTAARFDLWKIAWQMFAEHPILGHGASSFGYFAEDRGMPGFHDGPHNLFLNLMSELGLVGLVTLAFVLLFGAFKTMHQPSYPEFIAISGIFIFRMYESLVGTGLNDRQSWLIFAMMLAVPFVNRDETENIQVLDELHSVSDLEHAGGSAPLLHPQEPVKRSLS